MADRYLLESGSPDGYLLEDSSGVLLLEPPQLTVDASTPPFAAGSNDPWVTASFTPPVDSLLVIIAVGDWFGSTPTLTPTSTGLTFVSPPGGGKFGAINNGVIQIWTAEVGALGGSARTVSVATTQSSDVGGVQVYVLTNYDTTTIVDTTGSNTGSPDGTNNWTPTVLTTGVDGCRVFGGAVNWVGGNLASTSTDVFAEFNDADLSVMVARKAAITSPAGPVTLNFDQVPAGTPVWTYGAISINPAPAADPDADITATSVNAVASVPTAAIQAGSTVTPGSVNAVASIPAPTVQAGGALAQPATVAAVAAIPAPTISTGAKVTPVAVAAVAAVPAPTIQAGSVVAPSTVTAVATIPSAAVSAGGSANVSPATVNAVAAVPAPALTTSSKVTPAAVAAVAAIPSPTKQAGSKATPAAVTAVAAIPAPAVQAGTRTTPATVTAVTVIPAPTVRLGALLGPATVTARAGVPAPTMRTSMLVPAFTVAAVATIPAPTVTTLLPFIPLTDPVTVVRGNDAAGRPVAHLAAAAAGNNIAAAGQRANLAVAAARPNPAEATT